MRDLAAMRQRFERDALPVRLGNLASNLARLRDWACGGQCDEALVDLMREIAYQMEWSGESGLAELPDMQREICFWRRAWPVASARPMLALRARAMSDQLLQLSGLPDTGIGASREGR